MTEDSNDGALKIIFDEAVRTREEIIGLIEGQYNRISSLINIILILVGLFLTVTLFAQSMNENIRMTEWILVIIIISMIFLMLAVGTGLWIMAPVEKDIIIKSDKNEELEIADIKKILSKMRKNHLERYHGLTKIYRRNRVALQSMVVLTISGLLMYFSAWLQLIPTIQPSVLVDDLQTNETQIVYDLMDQSFLPLTFVIRIGVIAMSCILFIAYLGLWYEYRMIQLNEMEKNETKESKEQRNDDASAESEPESDSN